MYGGIEAGGTKFICAVGNSPTEIVQPVMRVAVSDAEARPRDPAEVFAEVVNFFKPYAANLSAIGIASFGPVDLHPNSPTYGYITSTPKPKWAFTDMLTPLRTGLSVQHFGFDTDVNAAAVGEWRYGHWGQNVNSLIYMTIGTGIGGGAVVNGRTVSGLVHPEMGHLPVRRHPGDSYLGGCPYHDDCLEGLANGPALLRRWGVPGHELPDSHVGWQFEAYYLAQAVCTMLYMYSPERIILGGGVMHKEFLFEMIRREAARLLKGYINHPRILSEFLEDLVVPPALGDNAGITGALELARLASE